MMKSTVYDFLKKYDETKDYERKFSTGRKRKLAQTDLDHAVLSIKRDRLITRKE